MEPRTPYDLLQAGIDSLPCGFSLRHAFRDRLRHYKNCPDAYCQNRLRESRNVSMMLADAIRRRNADRCPDCGLGSCNCE